MPTTSLLRGVNSDNTHWVTINALPSGFTLKHTYTIIGLTANVANTSMLYECTANNYNSNFITRNSTCEGQTLIQKLGYTYDNLQTNTSELYRCHKVGKDHYVSSDYTEKCVMSKIEKSLGYYIIS